VAAITVGGRAQHLAEHYHTVGGQESPLLSPVPVLPIDLPAFPAGTTKGLGQYTYEASSGTAGQKGAGEVGFAVAVEQEVVSAADSRVKSLAADPFVKNMDAKTTVGVRLKGPYGQVKQLWRPGMPWPVGSDNGTTTSRLVEFQPAHAAGEVRP
jgi:hypothetical protein